MIERKLGTAPFNCLDFGASHVSYEHGIVLTDKNNLLPIPSLTFRKQNPTTTLMLKQKQPLKSARNTVAKTW